MKEQIKQLRVSIDGLAQLTKELKPMDCNSNNPGLKNNSPQIEKAYDSLILAKAWLGKMLGELGVDNPYKSGYKTKEDIEPTQDVSEVLCTTGLEGIATNKTWKELNHIEKVDCLRTEIEKIVNEIKSIARTDAQNFTKEFNISRTNCYNHLCEARFWLGFELERIKNS